MPKYVVAAVDEIPPSSRKIVEINGRSIGIFNVEGQFFALRNRCPHQGGPLCAGTLGGLVSATAPGDYQYSSPGRILRCPWHGWEFDVRTGQSWFDPNKVRVRSYDVTLEPAPAAPAGDATPPAPGLERGPYVAETYDVSIERSRVVVDVPN